MVASGADTVQLRMIFRGPDGQPTDTDSLPTVSIIQPGGGVLLAPTSNGVVRTNIGEYVFNFTLSIHPPIGVWRDVWSGVVEGFTILRRFREGEARFEGSLQDYAGLALSFIDLYQTTFRAHYITRAMQIAQVIATKFKAEGGGFFDTADGIPDLLVRSMEIYDGVEPSGNALAAMLFGTLARYGYENCGSVAEEILARFGGEVATHAPAHCMMLLGLDLYLNPPHEVAIVDGSDALGDSILAELRPRLSIGSIIARGEDQSIPLLKSRKAEGGKTTVYVCRNFVCDRPVHSAAEALALL
jgi:uncharacterized protein YyaL (SSP411 family)